MAFVFYNTVPPFFSGFQGSKKFSHYVYPGYIISKLWGSTHDAVQSMGLGPGDTTKTQPSLSIGQPLLPSPRYHMLVAGHALFCFLLYHTAPLPPGKEQEVCPLCVSRLHYIKVYQKRTSVICNSVLPITINPNTVEWQPATHDISFVFVSSGSILLGIKVSRNTNFCVERGCNVWLY